MGKFGDEQRPKCDHDALCEKAGLWLLANKHAAVGCNIASFGDEYPDAIGWTTNGESTVLEIKTNRADFLADFRKTHRIAANGGVGGLGSRRFYVAVPDIVYPSDDIGFWGYIEVRGERFYKIKDADPCPSVNHQLAQALMCRMLRVVHSNAEYRSGNTWIATRYWPLAVNVLAEGVPVTVAPGLPPDPLDEHTRLKAPPSASEDLFG